MNGCSRVFIDICDHFRSNESSIVVLDHCHRVEMGDVRLNSCFIQQLLHFAGCVLQGQGEMIFLLLAEFVDLFHVTRNTLTKNLLDLSVGKAFAMTDQIQRGQQTLHIPSERSTITFVEVVHVEIQDPFGVQIRAEVLAVQVALNQSNSDGERDVQRNARE